MKIYHLKRKDEADWDETEDFIIRASSPRAARRMANNTNGDELHRIPNFWLDTNLTTCEELKAEGDARIIVQEFRSSG